MAMDVVRVHHERIAKVVRGAGELAQHEHPVFLDPGGAVLVGDEVHAIAERRDEADVRRPVVSVELRGVQGAVEVVNGDPSREREAPIDVADQPVDLVLQVPVGLHRLPRGHHHLHEHGPLPQRRPAREEPAPRREALGTPFV